MAKTRRALEIVSLMLLFFGVIGLLLFGGSIILAVMDKGVGPEAKRLSILGSVPPIVKGIWNILCGITGIKTVKNPARVNVSLLCGSGLLIYSMISVIFSGAAEKLLYCGVAAVYLGCVLRVKWLKGC